MLACRRASPARLTQITCSLDVDLQPAAARAKSAARETRRFALHIIRYEMYQLESERKTSVNV